jgi:hypothetical protein
MEVIEPAGSFGFHARHPLTAFLFNDIMALQG